jgi:hypothetical protein
MTQNSNQNDDCQNKENPVPRLLIDCRELPAVTTETLENIRVAFQEATPCVTAQTWRPEKEPDFAPAQVRTGWRGNSLLVFAELTDTDIYNQATRLNQRIWELGDAFEIFLRPEEQSTYVEFHISPENQRLQLRFPDASWLAELRKTGSIEKVLIQGEAFRSLTWVQPDAGKWFVYAEIPASSVFNQPHPIKGSQWHFSFSRYDYTRGRKAPVISSTSPHTVANFHRQEEWGLLKFQG